MIAGITNLFLGIYILYLNPKSKMNFLYFLSTVALEVWAFGLGMALSANNLTDALFWRRFAAIGWGSFFSILLHYFLVFTGKERLLKKWWIYPALYLPSIITYLGFTYFPAVNPQQYNLVQSALGWINLAVNNGWDWFYSAYYMLYSFIGYYLIWQWGRKSGNPKLKKQSHLILLSFLFTMLVGSLTDIMSNALFSVLIPQIAPILMVFPTIVIHYTIKKYGLMNPHHVDEEAALLTEQIRAKMINYMSSAFIAAGLLHFISQYLLKEQTEILPVLLFSAFLMLIGFLFQSIQHVVKNNQTKDILNAMLFSIIVPVITLKYIDYASVTIWAFPFLLLIISLVFDNKFIQKLLAASIILTQILVWMIHPSLTTAIDAPDYAVRIGLFLIAIYFAFFIKKIFTAKLRENIVQINTQKLIAEISSDFVSVNEKNLETKINATLLKLAAFANAVSVSVFLLDEKQESLICKHVFFANEKVSDREIPQIINRINFPMMLQQLKNMDAIALSDTSDLSDESGEEIRRFVSGYDKAFLAMPIVIRGVLFGFLEITAQRRITLWSDSEHHFFKIISNIFADAFEKVNKEKEINYMAFYDDLTKLPNRLLFKDRVMQAIHLAERNNKIISVIFIDIDAFKTVNDSVGHEGGDRLLVNVSEKLSKLVRKSDTVSRFGGDEFMILLNHLNGTDDIERIIKKILSIFEEPFLIKEQEYFVTASAGVAVYPFDGGDSDTLIKNADIAMYKAKEQGKNQYLFCTADMKKEVLLKMRLMNNLYRALAKNEFMLHFQPQVCTRSKRIIAAEALLRWNHPELGMIPPNQFIPLTEQTGLIVPIGEWVLRTACMQCKTWQLSGFPDMRIAVNVSIIQLRNPDFVSRLKRILQETQLEAQYLELEITESAAVNESEYIFEVLDKLKALHLSISIDDFGTEYSSLSRLTSMPIDRIKMDMQFVRRIHQSDKDKAIALGIINLAHNLGLKVIAEGVETESQLDFLCQKDCDEIQGFYFYRPLNADDFDMILKSTI